MDDVFTQEGREVFETFCAAMQEDDWNFTPHEEDLVITCGAKGEDLPIEIMVRVDSQRKLLTVLSRMPLVFPEDKRVDGNLAVCVANNGMVHGCFDFDNSSGKVYFRMSNSYRGCKVSKALCLYMLYCACSSVDAYNDKLLMLSKGFISLEQFIKSENA